MTMKPLLLRDDRDGSVHSFLTEDNAWLPGYRYVRGTTQDMRSLARRLPGWDKWDKIIYNGTATYDPTMPEREIRHLDPKKAVNLLVHSHHKRKVPVPQEYDSNEERLLHLGKFSPRLLTLISHAVGSGEPTTAFINWLAAKWKYPSRLGTSWILSGCVRSGRELLHRMIFEPLFEAHAQTFASQDIDKTTYHQLEWCSLLTATHVPSRMPHTVSRVKRIACDESFAVCYRSFQPYLVKNWADVVALLPDDSKPMLSSVDCRWNVGRFQPVPIVRAHPEFALFPNKDAWIHEVGPLADMLNEWEVDHLATSIPADTTERRSIIGIEPHEVELCARAVTEPDPFWFEKALEVPARDDVTKAAHRIVGGALCGEGLSNQEIAMTMNEIWTVYQVVASLESPTFTAFCRMMRGYGVVYNQKAWARTNRRRNCVWMRWDNEQCRQILSRNTEAIRKVAKDLFPHERWRWPKEPE